MLPLLVTVSAPSLVFTKIPAIPFVVPVVVPAFSACNVTPVSAWFENLISKSFDACVIPVFLPPNAIANPFLSFLPK